MSDPKLTPWKKGPPPCRGWWIASAHRRANVRRYWNGSSWSCGTVVGTSDREAEAARIALTIYRTSEIEWRGLAEKPE